MTNWRSSGFKVPNKRSILPLHQGARTGVRWWRMPTKLKNVVKSKLVNTISLSVRMRLGLPYRLMARHR